MERTSINPVSWSIDLGFDQAELVQGHHRLLVCSAQDAMDAHGAPQHPGDMARPASAVPRQPGWLALIGRCRTSARRFPG